MAFFFETEPQLILIAALTFIVSWVIYTWRRQATIEPDGMRLPPSLPSLPIVGSLPFMDSNPNRFHKFLMQQATKCGNVFAFNAGTQHVVTLNGYKCINEALVKKAVHFAGRPPIYFNSIQNNERKGIIPSPYNDSFRRRRQLYISILKEFGFGQRLIEDRINVEVAEFVHQVRQTKGQPFDPSNTIHLCLANVITSVLFGRRYPFGHPGLCDISDHIQRWFASVVQEIELFRVLRFVPPFRGRLQKYTEVLKSFMDLIEREVNVTLWNADHEQGEKNPSFVSRFVESTATAAGGGPVTSLSDAIFDRKELVEVVWGLFLGSDDTSTTTMRWILVELANRPDVQGRLHEEVDAVIGRDRLPSLADESRMPYLQAFLLELLRRYTVVAVPLHRETTCDTRVGDCWIKKDTRVVINLYSANMDVTEWAEPEVFKPERFLDENGQVTGKERVVTFGLGRRSCTGEPLARQVLFLFVAGIVQNFDILPPEGETVVSVDEVVKGSLQPTPFSIRLTTRSN